MRGSCGSRPIPERSLVAARGRLRIPLLVPRPAFRRGHRRGRACGEAPGAGRRGVHGVLERADGRAPDQARGVRNDLARWPAHAPVGGARPGRRAPPASPASSSRSSSLRGSCSSGSGAAPTRVPSRPRLEALHRRHADRLRGQGVRPDGVADRVDAKALRKSPRPVPGRMQPWRSAEGGTMSVETRNPSELFAPTTYFASRDRSRHTDRLPVRTGRLDARGEVVGRGDLAAQAEQAYLNVGAALKAVGATFQDVAKMTVFVVDWTPAKIESLVAARCASGADRLRREAADDPDRRCRSRDAGLPDRGRSGRGRGLT